MPNPRKQDRELDALYAELPTMRCQGFCSDSCGPIDMSIRERARIIERARKPITCGAGATCSMLTEDRRCSVYDIRPMICRLWGIAKSMPCPYGCRPEGGLLPDADAVQLLLRAEQIGETPMDRTKMQRSLEEAIRLVGQDAEVQKLMSGFIRKGRATVDGRAETLRRTGVRFPFER